MGSTRDRLVASALAMVREHGWDAVTLRGVGERSGVSRTAPYRHFADKTDLLASVALVVLTEMAATIEADLAKAAGGDPVRMLLTSYVDFAIGRPAEYRLVYNPEFTKGDYPPLRLAALMAADRVGEVLGFTGPSARARAMAVVSAAHGMAELAIGGHFGRKQLTADQVIDALLDGKTLRPRRRATAR